MDSRWYSQGEARALLAHHDTISLLSKGCVAYFIYLYRDRLSDWCQSNGNVDVAGMVCDQRDNDQIPAAVLVDALQACGESPGPRIFR